MVSDTKQKNLLSLIVIFLSGISALIYQLVWLRELRLLFGVSTYALSTVLAAFMAGLALGNLLFGRMADRSKNVLRLLAFLEAGIAVFALLFPFIMQAFLHLYAEFAQPGVGLSNTLIRFLFSFTLLIIPTSLMGAALPVLGKFLIRERASLGFQFSRLVFLYNLGAVVGCFATGYFLIRLFGHQNANWIAVFLNILNAALLFIMARKIQPSADVVENENLWQPQQAVGNHNDYSKNIVILVLWVLALEGFAALAYEVIWTRILLGLSYDKSIFFTSTIIGTFLFGLFLGGVIVHRLLDKKRNLLAFLAALEIAIGISALLILPVFNKLSIYLNSIRPLYVDAWLTSVGKENLIMFAILLVPTTLMGMTFPVAGKITVANLNKLGQKVGVLGSLDTVGSIAGALAAGFLLIPALGVFHANLVTALINLVLGALLVAVNPYFDRTKKYSLTAVVVVAGVMSMLFLPKLPGYQQWYVLERSDRLLSFKQGAVGAVSVHQDIEGEKKLYINGSLAAYGEGDVRVDKVRGYLPSLLHENPKKSLIIGLGMGVAARSLIQPQSERVDVVELNPDVIDACAYFSNVNDSVLTHDRLNIIIEDGRQYLLLTDETYDVISSNSVHSRLSGNIYTQEFYEICRNRLADDGVMCQWIAYNWMSQNEFKSLLNAFYQVFPNMTLWNVDAGFAIMVGTANPMKVDWQQLEKRMQHPDVESALAPVTLADPAALMALYVTSGSPLRNYLAYSQPNTDDKPIAEITMHVNKARNPLIIQDMLRLKLGALDVIENYGGLEKRKEAVDRMDAYLMAEKFFIMANTVKFYSDDPLQKIEYLLQATRASSRDPRFFQSLSTLYFQTGRYKEAEIALRRLLELEPENPSHYDHIGQVFFKTEQYAKARAAFEHAIKLEPELPNPHMYMASIYGGMGDYEQAENELLYVMDLWPEFLEAAYRLGLVYEVTERPEKAARIFKDILRRDPDYKDTAERVSKLK